MPNRESDVTRLRASSVGTPSGVVRLVLSRRRCEQSEIVVVTTFRPILQKTQPRRHAGRCHVAVASKQAKTSVLAAVKPKPFSRPRRRPNPIFAERRRARKRALWRSSPRSVRQFCPTARRRTLGRLLGTGFPRSVNFGLGQLSR